jgi:O-antigen/teichoic acid export membrane protein
MVTGLAGLSQTGVYTTAFYIGLVIEMPRRAISQISIPIISSALRKNDHTTVGKHYRKVSINQLIIGTLLYLGIVVNLENIYALVPNNQEFISGMPVVIIIGMAKLIDMAFSQNSEILMLSKHYRFNVVTVMILGFFTIILNYLLIPSYGITGAAVASLVALLLFNLTKFGFIWVKFGFQPFSGATLIVIAIGALSYFISSGIPYIYSTIPDILVRSIAVTALFLGPVLLLRISKDINDTLIGLFRRFVS